MVRTPHTLSHPRHAPTVSAQACDRAPVAVSALLHQQVSSGPRQGAVCCARREISTRSRALSTSRWTALASPERVCSALTRLANHAHAGFHSSLMYRPRPLQVWCQVWWTCPTRSAAAGTCRSTRSTRGTCLRTSSRLVLVSARAVRLARPLRPTAALTRSVEADWLLGAA